MVSICFLDYGLDFMRKSANGHRSATETGLFLVVYVEKFSFGRDSDVRSYNCPNWAFFKYQGRYL